MRTDRWRSPNANVRPDFFGLEPVVWSLKPLLIGAVSDEDDFDGLDIGLAHLIDLESREFIIKVGIERSGDDEVVEEIRNRK